MDSRVSERPLHDTQIYQANEERQHWILFAVVLTIILIFGFVVFLLTNQTFRNGLDSHIIIGLNATSLALILACAYFFAFRYFEDLFYLFIAIGWLANASYLPFEFLFDSRCGPPSFEISHCYQFALRTYALSFVSSVAFYLATLTKRGGSPSYSPLTIIGSWAAGIIVFMAGSYAILQYIWSASPSESFAFRFMAYATPGAIFSAYGLVRVGNHISGVVKLSQTTRDATLRLLSLTFYCYAFLQLAYPFKIFLLEASPVIFPSLFVIGFAIKITNGYCLVKVLLQVKYPEFVRAKSEVEELQERLGRQSQLAALGAIAASIEHDMKTPLSGISTKLVAMRNRYSDKKILWYINKLELDKNRIAAIAKVVPFMRGAEDFYNRDRFMGRVPINEVVNLAIRVVKIEMSLDTKKFFFRINPGPDGKPQHKNMEYFVRAYTPMLEQMVVNLFKNGIEAIKETGRDRGVITIRINAIRGGTGEVTPGRPLKEKYVKWVRVEIEDNGCGIPEENISKLTTLFTTKHDRKPNGGIGLFIANRLLKVHEGYMEINSKEGKGTTVSIYLPEWDAYQEYALKYPAGSAPDDLPDEDLEPLALSLNEQPDHAVSIDETG